MALQDELQPGSFRGVPFQVSSADLGAGRRTQVHEYPQRDKPYAEDMGRAVRDISFTAYVVGSDYIAQANALLAALETPGAGKLVHPWFGEMQVSLRDSARISFDSGLGRATLQLAFVEAGELVFPLASTSTQQASRDAASALQQASADAFADRFSVDGFQDFVASIAASQFSGLLTLTSSSEVGKLLGLANGLASTITTVIGLMSSPALLTDKVFSVFGLAGLASTISSWTSIVRSLSRTSLLSGFSTPDESTVITPSRLQVDANTGAVHGLIRQALLVQAIGASSLVGTSLDAAATPVVSYTDMLGVRDDLIAAIDAESLSAADAVYSSLQAARAAVWQDLTTRARDNARLDTITPPAVLPALVVSYLYYGVATRDAEIVARNRIRHPGFVPAEPLKVLTK